MLKSKSTLYILFPLVILIWGMLIYRIVGGVKEEPQVIPIAALPEEKPIQKIKKDTFSLLPLTHDPFLGHSYRKKEPVKIISSAPAVKVEWPEITYLGLVSDVGDSKQVHVIQINGKQFLITKGEDAQGVKIINFSQDGIILEFKGNRREFLKKKEFDL